MSVQTIYSKAPTNGGEGQIYDLSFANDIVTMRNAEATASIPFGVAVAFKTSSPATDFDALNIATTSDKVAGFVVHSHDYARTFTAAAMDGTFPTVGELASDGLRPNSILQIMRKGRLWVKVEQAVVPGDRLFVRADVATGENTWERFGQASNAADESDMIDLTKVGVFITSAAALGLAVLEVDFTNKP